MEQARLIDIDPSEINIRCENNLDFLGELDDESVKLIVTSPPYNIGKSYENKILLEDYVAEQKEIVERCARVLQQDGSICWQTGNHVSNGEVFPLDIMLYPIFKRLGLQLRNRIVWAFGHGLHCSKRLSGRHETILWFTKSESYVFNLDSIRVPSKYPSKKHFKGPNQGKLSGNPMGKNPTDVWEIPNVKSNHIEKTVHPCQFPVELVERLVLALTNRGDSVLDPFMGVGSTIIAAIKHGRKGLGCDIIPEYVEIARERLHQFYAGELRLREMGKPVYDPSLPYGGHK